MGDGAGRQGIRKKDRSVGTTQNARDILCRGCPRRPILVEDSDRNRVRLRPKSVGDIGSINSFCQTCWDWSDFRKAKSAPLPMKFVWDSVIFNTRLARPEKDAFEASSHRKELDMVLLPC